MYMSAFFFPLLNDKKRGSGLGRGQALVPFLSQTCNTIKTEIEKS